MLVGFALVVVAVVALRRDPDYPIDVAMGDSVTFLSSSAITEAFSDAGWKPGDSSRIGWRIDQMRPAIQIVADRTPELRRMFINLGANDASKYEKDPTWPISRSIDNLRATVADVTGPRPDACVFLVTLTDSTRTSDRRREAVAALNAEIKKLAASSSKIYVVDWRLASAGHPEWFTSERGGNDGVHPNAEGSMAMAQLYVDVGKRAEDCAPRFFD